MINKKICIFVLFIILLSVLRVYADNNLISKSDEPMEITSNKMEAFNEKKLVVFSGNAKVTQGKNVLKADKLLLYYKKDPDKKEKIGSIDTERTGDLEKIEAKGNVYLT
ncbi:MAG: LptA/OstA family protein, partial [Smithella sp.]